jgi:hypothetical protein
VCGLPARLWRRGSPRLRSRGRRRARGRKRSQGWDKRPCALSPCRSSRWMRNGAAAELGSFRRSQVQTRRDLDLLGSQPLFARLILFLIATRSRRVSCNSCLLRPPHFERGALRVSHRACLYFMPQSYPNSKKPVCKLWKVWKVWKLFFRGAAVKRRYRRPRWRSLTRLATYQSEYKAWIRFHLPGLCLFTKSRLRKPSEEPKQGRRDAVFAANEAAPYRSPPPTALGEVTGREARQVCRYPCAAIQLRHRHLTA